MVLGQSPSPWSISMVAMQTFKYSWNANIYYHGRYLISISCNNPDFGWTLYIIMIFIMGMLWTLIKGEFPFWQEQHAKEGLNSLSQTFNINISRSKICLQALTSAKIFACLLNTGTKLLICDIEKALLNIFFCLLWSSPVDVNKAFPSNGKYFKSGLVKTSVFVITVLIYSGFNSRTFHLIPEIKASFLRCY